MRQLLNDKDFDQLKDDLLWEGSPVAVLSRDENQYLIAMQVPHAIACNVSLLPCSVRCLRCFVDCFGILLSLVTIFCTHSPS